VHTKLLHASVQHDKSRVEKELTVMVVQCTELHDIAVLQKNASACCYVILKNAVQQLLPPTRTVTGRRAVSN